MVPGSSRNPPKSLLDFKQEAKMKTERIAKLYLIYFIITCLKFN